jgi:hypothetical protein
MMAGTIVVGCGLGFHFDAVKSRMGDRDVDVFFLLDAALHLNSRSVASSPLVPALRRCRGGSQVRWRLPVLVQMHQNGLGCALVVSVLMSMMSIRARKRVTCAIVALRLVVAVVGVGLWPCAFWGSWCILGQTHETSHVDGNDGRARLCIYLNLKVSLAGCHSNFSPDSRTTEEPSGGSRWMERIVLAVQTVTENAECSKVQTVAAVCSCRSLSISEAVMKERLAVRM